MSNRSAWTVSLGALLLTACGGGGGGGGPTGTFLDSAVQGLTATSASKITTTNADGRFAYVSGAQVMFAIGDIVIGLGLGEAVMTPVDLVPGAVDELDDEVTNIARLLQTLDFDQDPDNGIFIDDSVHQAAVGLGMDFSQSIANFEASEQATVDLLTAGLPGGARPLVPVADAQEHLGDTLRIVVAGRYDGRFAGDDAGPFSVYVDREGVLFGWAFSPFDGLIALTGGADTDGGFLAGNASTGATFSGLIESDGTLAGTWQLDFESGTFSGRRTIALDTELDHDLIEMFEGTWIGTYDSNQGSEPFTAFLDDDGNFALPAPDDQVSGAITSTSGTTASFSGLTDEGTEFQGTLTLPGTMDATFRNDFTGEVGTFTATLQ